MNKKFYPIDSAMKFTKKFLSIIRKTVNFAQNSCLTTSLGDVGRGGSLVVSVVAFNSDDPSSKLANFVVKCLKR